MGHGLCETFTKQIQLIAPGGHASSDDKIIGEHAWRLLKGLNFDPKELRGVGIQVQKLEKSSGAAELDQGQAILPFKPLNIAKQRPDAVRAEQSIKSAEPPEIIVQPPSSPPDQNTVPGARENAKARDESSSHDLPSFSQVDRSVFDALPEDIRKELEAEFKRRSTTPNPAPQPSPAKRVRFPSLGPRDVFPKIKITVKGTNVKRITQQLFLATASI